MSNFVDGFCLLTDENETFTITPDLLTTAPNGILALAGDDAVTGSSGNDRINGNSGNDTLEGNSGADRLWGGQDLDFLFGGSGDDILNGNKGNDVIAGGEGNDILRGGQETDAITGEAGDDTIFGDRGSDVVVGGSGRDLMVISLPDDTSEIDAILDFQTAEADQIGLPPELTEADLLLQPFSLSVDQALLDELVELAEAQGIVIPTELIGFVTPEFIRQTMIDIVGVDIDPDGDNMLTGTSVTVAETNQTIAQVVNVMPTDLAGAFVTLSAEQLAIG